MEDTFEIYNNQLTQQLVGPQDSNLKTIETLLGVEISFFGNQIIIKGSEEAVKQARMALEIMQHKLIKGHPLGEAEVKAAVRLSDNPDAIESKDEETAMADIVLKT